MAWILFVTCLAAIAIVLHRIIPDDSIGNRGRVKSIKLPEIQSTHQTSGARSYRGMPWEFHGGDNSPEIRIIEASAAREV